MYPRLTFWHGREREMVAKTGAGMRMGNIMYTPNWKVELEAIASAALCFSKGALKTDTQ